MFKVYIQHFHSLNVHVALILCGLERKQKNHFKRIRVCKVYKRNEGTASNFLPSTFDSNYLFKNKKQKYIRDVVHIRHFILLQSPSMISGFCEVTVALNE